MVTVEYEEFVRQFRARTATRLAEFEKALAAAQAKTKSARAEPGADGYGLRGEQPGAHTAQVPPPVRGAPARARGRGPVQSVLRQL